MKLSTLWFSEFFAYVLGSDKYAKIYSSKSMQIELMKKNEIGKCGAPFLFGFEYLTTELIWFGICTCGVI